MLQRSINKTKLPENVVWLSLRSTERSVIYSMCTVGWMAVKTTLVTIQGYKVSWIRRVYYAPREGQRSAIKRQAINVW